MDLTEHEKNKLRFYERFHPRAPSMLLIYIVFTLGFYTLIWIYDLNRKFEEVDPDNSPLSMRGLVVLMVFPVFWYFVSEFSALLMPTMTFFTVFDILLIGWIIIVLLSLKYLYDFCVSYANYTDTTGLVWYLAIYPGYFAGILFYLGFYPVIIVVIMPIVAILVMQEVLNTRYDKAIRQRDALEFNTRTRYQ